MVATIAGVVLLDEQITVASLLGFVVIFVGFVLLKRQSVARLLGA